MKIVMLMILLPMGTIVRLLSAQTAPSQPEALRPSKSASIPSYLVYRHFLAWVNELNKSADGTNAYQVAKFFERARMENSDLDILRNEAKTLESDLAENDDQAKVIIAEYRRGVQSGLLNNEALPPVPSALTQLQTNRTAILVQHMVILQSALGPEKSAQLDLYLGREFVPHISMKPLAQPVARTRSDIPAQPFKLGH